MSDNPKPARYASWTTGKLPLPELAQLKGRGDKIVMVTAYDAPSGRLADAAVIDLPDPGERDFVRDGRPRPGVLDGSEVLLDEIVFLDASG